MKLVLLQTFCTSVSCINEVERTHEEIFSHFDSVPIFCVLSIFSFSNDFSVLTPEIGDWNNDAEVDEVAAEADISIGSNEVVTILEQDSKNESWRIAIES